MSSSWNRSTLNGVSIRVGTRDDGALPKIVVSAGTFNKYLMSNIDSFVAH